MADKTSERCKGHLDDAVEHRIIGWAINHDDPDTPVAVEILVDRVSIGCVTANAFRSDVAKALATNGNHGFAAEIPTTLRDGKTHVVEALFADTRLPLDDSPRDILFAAPAPARSRMVDAGLVGRVFEGHLDSAAGGLVAGWILDAGHPETRLSVDLFVDGSFVRTAVADRWRADLYGKGDGYCSYGFSIPIPPRFQDSGMHMVEVLVAGTDTPIKNSPLHVTLEPSPTRVIEQRSWIRSCLSGTTQQGGLGKGISVVIPTYNRAAMLEACLLKCLECSSGLKIEFIVIDDGSKDDTRDRLLELQKRYANIRFESVPQGGPGQARNMGAAMANHELLMFIGDDIRPGGPDFFRAHLLAHHLFPETHTAVLGKITWPNQHDENVTFVMAHIQGIGQQQFGFHYLEPYTWLDWRFFYTSNLSVKRSVLSDWTRDGFSSAFHAAAFEDAELAYRLTRASNGAFRILYAPASTAVHLHPYSVKSFIHRQASCGSMARVFLDMHPELASAIGVEGLDEALSHQMKGAYGEIGDYLSVIAGLKGWACLIETTQNLGSQNWHADLLSAVFELSYLQGCIDSVKNPGANYSAAYQFILQRFQQRMSRAAAVELFGKYAGFKVA
jgi:glycosyltransferase involved in cell wall biosynthesis